LEPPNNKCIENEIIPQANKKSTQGKENCVFV
jgi:hypothetical protein